MYEYLRDNLVEFADHLTTLNIPASYSRLIYDTVDAINDMNDVIAGGNWIPVSTPPKVGQTVWVTYISALSGEAKVAAAYLNHRGEWRWSEGNGVISVEITHWQPYPQPAKQPKTTPQEVNALLYDHPFGNK